VDQVIARSRIKARPIAIAIAEARVVAVPFPANPDDARASDAAASVHAQLPAIRADVPEALK
jgi:hypothetical protein